LFFIDDDDNDNKNNEYFLIFVDKDQNEIKTIYRGMVGAHQNLNGSRDLTDLLSGMICHPRARICYYQPAYQIWSLYLCPLQRYEKKYKIWKMGWFGV